MYKAPSQRITSKKTSVNSVKLPSLFSRVSFSRGTKNLDLGGGKFDNVKTYLEGQGVSCFVLDPFNRPEEENQKAFEACANGQADTVTVSNVLNVIQEKENRLEVLKLAKNALKENGKLFVYVYQGDKTGEGRETLAGFQHNKKTSFFFSEVSEVFETVKVVNGVIIARKEGTK